MDVKAGCSPDYVRFQFVDLFSLAKHSVGELKHKTFRIWSAAIAFLCIVVFTVDLGAPSKDVAHTSNIPSLSFSFNTSLKRKVHLGETRLLQIMIFFHYKTNMPDLIPPSSFNLAIEAIF